MADWLNALLAGPYTVQVYQNGLVVDPASVGASIAVNAGVMTLNTPGEEAHEWDVLVTPTYLNTAVPMRIKSIVLAGDVLSAVAQSASPAQTIPITVGPPLSPDPATFTLPSLIAGIGVVEEEAP